MGKQDSLTAKTLSFMNTALSFTFGYIDGFNSDSDLADMSALQIW